MSEMIEGVQQISLKKIKDDRGMVMHMLRATDPNFIKFGEVYFSWTNPGIVKAWKKHQEMVQNYTVPVGYITVVLFDDRTDSPTKGKVAEYAMGPEDYYLLTIPAKVWYGFKNTGSVPAMIVNCATLPHDPSEVVRTSSFDDPSIPYSWGK